MNDRFWFRTPIYRADGSFKKLIYWGAVSGFPAITAEKGDVFKEAEQCTGLEDKNGRLICEGDIISIFGGSQYEIVKWCEGRLGYFVEVQLSAGADFGPECLGNLRDVIEVIGNIHENADLLEEENETDNSI